MRLDNKNIVVIGGAGLIGSHTVDQLLNENVKEILIYDNMTRGSEKNLKNALSDKRVKISDIGGDILQSDILEKSLRGADGVFHFERPSKNHTLVCRFSTESTSSHQSNMA